MKLYSVLRRKGFPLILTYLIVSILCCLTVPILDYLTVPMVAGSEETLVTMSVYDMQSYFEDDLVVDVYINVTEPTNIIGWEINVKVNPEVLAPGYYYEPMGVTFLAAADESGYFLYDWTLENPGNITIFSEGIPDNETGTITAVSQTVQGWREMPGVGADTDGLWEKLVTLYFTQLNATPAYSPILLTEAWYSTSKYAPDDDTHEANVINGHFGTPIHDVATTSVSTSPSVNATRGTVIQIGVKTFNLGGYNETFTVTFSYNKTATEWEFIGNYTFALTPLESGTKSFLVAPFWDTEYVELGNYTFKAVHNLTDANLDNDNATTTIEITRPEWDVAVTAISAPSEATAGGSVDINVTVANEGTKPITNVTVTVSYDGTIEEQNFTDVLAYGETIVLTFEWDTTGVAPENYTIEAEAVPPLLLNSTPVSERVEYNNFESTEVEIKIPDFNGNGVVDAVDLYLFAKAYGSPPGAGVIDLYVNADDETKTDWTRHGTNPYLNASDYPANYVHVTGKPNLVGDFGFEDSGKTIESITSVTVQLYAKQSGSNRLLEVFVWDGSSWTSLGTQIVSPSWSWMTWTATTVLDTWAKIDGAKIYIGTLNAGLYEVDCGRLQVDYVTHELADLDYDGDVDSDDLDLFLENYGKST